VPIVPATANVVLPLAYLLVAADYGFIFFSSNTFARRSATPALGVAILLHLGSLAALAWTAREFPATTESQALSLLAFAVAVVYAFVEWRGHEQATGFWIVSLAFFFQLLASLLAHPAAPGAGGRQAIFHDPIFSLHVSLALLGYAAFAVAAAYAFLYLQLYRDLKAGRFATFYGRLPPLAVLERMMMVALGAGFVALTAAVLTGALWAERLYASSWLHDPKIVATLVTWAVYGATLLLRRLQRWQGRQTALASLAGLGTILFSLVAVNLFFTGFHGFL
jgi:HemX protein